MSSAQNKSRQSAKSASSPEPKIDDQTHPVPQPPSSEESAMDQPLDSTLTAIPPTPPTRPAPPTPSETMSSTEDSSSPAPTPPPAPVPPTPAPPPAESVSTSSPSGAAEDAASNEAVTRLQPIPPASEPMQYRAIGLVRGQYVASDEQFTRGTILTDDGFEIGAVLLGRVMSLVKKHVDLEQPHLWVVYPRTKEKGDGDLHVQIVGVWEPENLNRMMDSSEPDSSEQDLDEPDLADEVLAEQDLDEMDSDEPEDETDSDETPDELDLEPVSESSSEEVPAVASAGTEAAAPGDAVQSEAPTVQEATPPPVSADELNDKYFSVRGEIIYQSIEEQQILVKIRRIPRSSTEQSKAFKVALKGTLEGKAVGYFWDLNVQREGNMLVVQDGTMIAAVPPQKRDKKPQFRGRRDGGGRRSGGRPPQSGGPRKPWQNREGSPRPSRPSERSGSDRPTLPNRENRPPSPRPIKRRNPEKPEG